MKRSVAHGTASAWVALLSSLLVAVSLAGLVSSAAHGQEPCTSESEPNDTELLATAVDGPVCIAGDLPSGDQDLAVWTVGADLAATRWSVTLEGVLGTQTLLQLFSVMSQVGEEVVADPIPVLEMTMFPDDLEPAAADDVLLPTGRYLVGIARSGLPGGGEPDMTGYRIRIEPGSPWPGSADDEPNDDLDSGGQLADAFETSGDRQGIGSDFYSWTVGEPARWDLSVAAPIGEPVTLELTDADGRRVDSISATSGARLYDLELEPGTYHLRVPEFGTVPSPYILAAAPAVMDGDPEPNDDTASAIVVEDGEPVRGRLAKEGDRDRFTLAVPAGPPELRDVRMLWRHGAHRKLCLLGGDDLPIDCQDGTEGIALSNLRLSPGDHTFEVSGPRDPEDTYLLRVDVVGPAVADFEAEPNGTVETATDIDPDLGMTGRGAPGDVDLFRLHLEGSPQLWQVNVHGSGIRRAELQRASSATLASADIVGDGTSASLADLYLVPGDHWLRVDATGNEYTISTVPLGPPDPDGEREPNDDAMRAQRYVIGSRRVGRLPNPSDRDTFRFTLAAPQHIQLALRQPEGAATSMAIFQGGDRLYELKGLPPGQPIEADLWLEAGDHLVELAAEQVSEEPYELTSTRLDPFALVIDREPNDSAAQASTVPASLAWSGTAADPDDEDWYAIPPLGEADPLRITVAGNDVRVRLEHDDPETGMARPVRLDPQGDGTHLAPEAPLDVPMRLAVRAGGSYGVELGGGGLRPEPVASPPALAMTLDLGENEVAAYWPTAQSIDAALDLVNEGDAALDLDLVSRTSDRRWQVSLETDRVSVAPGASVRIPAVVAIPGDAWAGEPVQLTIAAAGVDSPSEPVSVSTEVTATMAATPRRPYPAWEVPPEVLGGLNLASTGLGAVPGGRTDADRELALFDGVTPDGGGFGIFLPDVSDERLPLEISVDLAGDAAVPVVATILNPQARDGKLDEVPREFTLLLSIDGESWTEALTGTLSPAPVDQVFVLDEPTPARHVMLRLESMHTDQKAYLALGEWKVIAEPDAVPEAAPLNVGDPHLGGHVLTFEPFDADETVGITILDEDLARAALDVGDVRSVGFTIGFQDARAAQLARLEWADPEGSQASTRLERLGVEASLVGPTGPWTPLGTWELDRAPDGAVTSFELGDGTWARYLRLRGQAPSDATQVELPGQLRVIEHEVGDGYRSVVGEWGYRSPAGPYEWSGSAATVSWTPDADAADSLAEAEVLPAGVTRRDIAEIDVDEDWYLIDVPAEDNSLEVHLTGQPTVRVEPTLVDTAGMEQPLTSQREPDGGVRYQADVEPGARYAMRVAQPPFSAVFTFDTSPSMVPFLDMVIAGIRSFLADVQPGREAVTILPFEEPPLVEGWEDDPYVLQDAFDNHVVESNGSSGVEAGLIDAADLLAEREGARAVLLVTDAETTTYERTSELWDRLSTVRPTIFSVHIGGTEEPVTSRQRMQDWAAVGGGHYSYPTTHGEMDRAFERMATWLRRPAAYSLRLETSRIVPAKLSVTAPTDAATGVGAAALAPGVGVEIILDTSGSMRRQLGGERRIDLAKASLRRLVREGLAEGVPVAIRTFGGRGSGKKAECGTTLTLPLAPLDRAVTLKRVKRLDASKKTATPIAAALAKVPQDLAAVDGLRTVVLITDGAATCGGDVPAAIAALTEAGVAVKLDVVGFALEDEVLKAEMAAWAAAGGGSYHDAASGAQLASSIVTAVSAPFLVHGPEGGPLAAGNVGGGPVEVEPGTYRVEVLTDPPVVFEEVVLDNAGSVTLTLPAPDE